MHWDYHEPNGRKAFQHYRYPRTPTDTDPRTKGYGYRYLVGDNEWVEGKPDGADALIYRLPLVLANPDVTTYLTEGERDADALLRPQHALASCHHGGAGKFTEAMAKSLARHKGLLVLVADNDVAGARDVCVRFDRLRDVGIPARRLRVVEVVPSHQGADLRDHLEAGHALDDLRPADLDRLRDLAATATGEPDEGSWADEADQVRHWRANTNRNSRRGPRMAETNKGNASTDSKPRRGLRTANASDVQTMFSAEGRVMARYSDASVAERVAKALTDRFCYSEQIGWLSWDGKVWTPVSETAVIEVVRKLHKKWFEKALGRAVVEGPRAGSPGAIKRLLSKPGIGSVVALIRGLLLEDFANFDQHRDLLNTQSGVVDLRNGAMRPHDPGLFFTKITACAYDAYAEHDDWRAVIDALRPDARGYVQVRVGQALTGYQPDDDVVCFLKGGGENGKSTFIGGITTPLGTYYRQVSDKVLLDDKGHSTELTDLRGLRLAVIEELPEGNRLNAVLLKKITSPEVTARRMNKDTMTFEISHALFVTSNYATQIAETDRGTWRRVMRIAFPYTYIKPGKKPKAEERVGDPGLRDRVRHDPRVQEAALRWMVDGAVAWYANDETMPPPPASVASDTDAWRRTSDLVQRYFDEFLVHDADSFIPSAALYQHFKSWLRTNGHSDWGVQLFSERFGGHEMVRAAGVEGPKQVKVSKSRAASYPPDNDGGTGERVTPFKAGKAWTGVRYVGQ